ncbi:purine nucleoside phosphorylase domain protein [Vibrio parahaemolyticus EKP-026]|nr:purine nucleoside phosphorylase domain protein [Vibrio parahaemolyticus EKP-026]
MKCPVWLEQISFVRVTFETGRVTAISDHHYRKSDRYMYMMVLMSFVCGMLFIMILRRQPIRRKKAENLLLTK